MNKLQHNLIRQFKSRYHLLRRLMILFAVLVGLQSYVHYANLESLLNKAVEQFGYLANEKQNLELTDQITDHFTALRALSAEAVWQGDLNEIQSEFQGFITAPGEGMGAVLGQVTAFNNKASMGKELIGQLETDLLRIESWHHDYYGDILVSITQPGVLYWPASTLFKWYDARNLLDTMQYNRSLYLILIGEVSAGQAILGELRTRLPDSPLRARTLFTQGRLLYGTGRHAESIKSVQDSIYLDPEFSLAKKFLEYQLSRGPDEEVEQEDESVQRVGTASSGEATLF